MSDIQHPKSQEPAWDALVAYLASVDAPPPAIIRAAYLEHVKAEKQKQLSLLGECTELRSEWEILAEIINPSQNTAIGLGHIKDVVADYAHRSPKPLLPRFPMIARVPLLRRFIR